MKRIFYFITQHIPFARHFSYADCRALIVLSILLIGIVTGVFIKTTKAQKQDKNLAMAVADIDSFVQQHPVTIQSFQRTPQQPKQPQTLTPFAFNPNTLPKEDWIKMGFSERQAQMVDNYRKKGGFFRTKADVRKLYFMTDELFAAIEPFIQLKEQPTKYKSGQPIQPVDINTADSLQLVAISGIGPFTATAIIRDREKLGGYYSVDQLIHIYAMTPERLAKIKPYLTCDTTLVKKININYASFKEVVHHLYIDYAFTKMIFDYRNLHGKFKSMDDFSKAMSLPDSIKTLLTPYLEFR